MIGGWPIKAVGVYCAALVIIKMDYEKLQSTSQVYKSSNWADRKRELKTTRNQRTTKSIKNIKSIDTPSDPNFNCNPLPIKIVPSTRRRPRRNPTNTAILLATRY